MKFLLLILLMIVSLCASDWNSFTYYPEMNHFYHPVTTDNQEAQEAFNEGLLAVYAFNSTQANKSFKKAAELDPNMAMAYWGLALSLKKSPEKKEEAISYITKAKDLEKNATENEKDYIAAIWYKYNEDQKAYIEAMQKLAQKHPDDVDALSLYAESMMDLLQWHLWTHEKKPKENTLKILEVLQQAIRQNPLHPGANHYYIHAVEDSEDPEMGLPSANRLNGTYPAWGHLLHTPTHIYIRLGDYEKSIICNLKGIESDKEYIKKNGNDNRYIYKFYLHNIGFLSRCYLWTEQYEKALESAKHILEYTEKVQKKIPENPEVLFAILQTYLYFHQWQEVLDDPKPSFDYVKTFWHFARAEAYLALNQLDKAEEERAIFLNLKEKNELKPLNEIWDLAALELNAFFEKAKGNLDESIDLFKKAVEKLDRLYFMKWHYQERQLLGKALLEAGRAPEAECVFREALLHMQRNGRSLFGLNESLKAQNKPTYWTERETKEALKYCDSFTFNDL